MRTSALRAVLGWTALVGGSLACTPQKAHQPSAPEIRSYPRGPLERDDQLAVIGDVQRTSIWGKMVLAESNLAEQKSLVDDLAKQSFRGLVLLGDMVFSDSDDNWNYFDELMTPVLADATRTNERRSRYFFPVMGNHDYMGSHEQIARQLGQRFSGFLAHTHYAFDWHHLRMIVLDGNRGKLCAASTPGVPACEAEWQAQLAWLRAELQKVDQAPAREQYGALLFVHQSPYTQSPLVADDQADARDFAKELYGSQRGLALISAHAHGFERYLYRRDTADLRPAKAFIVSAGGGGPRPHSRRAGAHPDLSTLAWPRPFNYLLLRQDENAVYVDVRGLEKGKQQVMPLSEEKLTLAFR